RLLSLYRCAKRGSRLLVPLRRRNREPAGTAERRAESCATTSNRELHPPTRIPSVYDSDVHVDSLRRRWCPSGRCHILRMGRRAHHVAQGTQPTSSGIASADNARRTARCGESCITEFVCVANGACRASHACFGASTNSRSDRRSPRTAIG